MPTLRVGHHDDWPTLGHDAIDWISGYLCHGPGDIQGEPFDDLDIEEIELLLDLYRLYPRGHRREGRRVVSDATYSRAKGSRKSELAGAIVCFEALGPARFDGFNAHGAPVGRPVKAPFIRCLATEEDQSGNTYDNVTVMLDHAAANHPDVFAGIDLGRSPQGSTRIFLPGSGEILPSTASSASKDGGKETFAVFDEIHLYLLPAHKGMRRTVRRNLMKRRAAEPWALNTTTSYRPGQGSDAEATHQRAEAIAEGRSKSTAGFYFNHREGLEVANWDDDSQVLAALHESYWSKAAWMDLERLLAEEIRDPEAEEPDSRRYFLNQSRQSSDTAFDPARWAELADTDFVAPDSSLIVAGFDGARFLDSTALIGTHVESGYQWVAGLWEKPFDAGDDWEVDEADVDAAVAELFDRYRLWRMYGDPPYWESALDRWAGRWGAQTVVNWWTNRDKPMAFALRAYSTAQKTGDLSHDGDDGFARHIANAHRRDARAKDEEGRPMWVIRKQHPKSPRKIDAAMAGCLAWEARGDCIAAGELAKANKRRRVVAF